jgi:DNA mismatch repair protein MutL
MNKIKVLSDNLANQIAAGEVVERPASVVKELVENSIDAGATKVRVDIELGGRRLIKITDNGEGMTRDDAILAFERHATSKISAPEDLGSISTLGFRGEALASIASVARVELTTKTESDGAATCVSIEGGRLLDVKDAARDTGTTICVRDLFFNTPARRKFMRSEATENYHLTTIVTHYALAHPEISFTLVNNGREIIRVAPARDTRERAFQIFGRELVDSLLHVDGGREYVATVSGFVSAPRERRTNRDSQYFFVNRRFVRDKTIASGLAEGFRSVLPHGVYPVAFLFIEMPLDELDVNVHPAKTEVRFRRSEAVKDAIAEAVRTALANAGIVAAAEPEQPVYTSPEPVSFAASTSNPEPPQVGVRADVISPTRPGDLSSESSPLSQNGAANASLFPREAFPPPESPSIEPPSSFSTQMPVFTVEEGISVPSQKLAEAEAELAPALPPVDSALKVAKSVDIDGLSVTKIKPLGQLHESFIIAADDEGLLLIDQHVAHERILFDKFRKSETERRIESQNLLLPETIDLSPAQSEAFQLVEDELRSLGFDMMRLSGRTVALKSVPTDVNPSEARNLFSELLDAVEKEKRGGAKSTLRDDIAASLACKAAVKINMKLTPEKMRWMIDRLLFTTSPTTCPHGRPVILRLSMRDIERAFHRS